MLLELDRCFFRFAERWCHLAFSMFEAIKTDYLTMAGSPRMNPRAVSVKIVSEFHVACHREIDSNANIICTVDDPFSSSPLVFCWLNCLRSIVSQRRSSLLLGSVGTERNPTRISQQALQCPYKHRVASKPQSDAPGILWLLRLA